MAVVGQGKLLVYRHIVALELKWHKAGIVLEDVTVQVYWGLHQAPT